MLDVWPDVFAWGVLVVPKELSPASGGRWCVQHGRNGVPRDAWIGNRRPTTISPRAGGPGLHHLRAAQPVSRRGSISLAQPQGQQRRATLFSFIIGQHERILDWLASLPFVDAERIAFYGLSYGGETAVRVPPILEKSPVDLLRRFQPVDAQGRGDGPAVQLHAHDRMGDAILESGADVRLRRDGVLMVPRPFMVERGHLDRVGRDQWVAHEYAKVRFLYAQLGLADRTEIEFFQGGHSINGQGTFAFLHKHLSWPVPGERQR